jgi:transcriptional regulator with XRE-family HTH domain
MNRQTGSGIVDRNRMSKSKIITDMVVEEMNKQGYSHKEFADLIGVTDRSVDYWVSGKRVMTQLDDIDRALKVLNLKVVLGKENGSWGSTTFTRREIINALLKIKEKK